MKTSKALHEVWEMKDAAYEETKHLKGTDYFRYIHEQVSRAFPAEAHVRKETIKPAPYESPCENEASTSQAVAET